MPTLIKRVFAPVRLIVNKLLLGLPAGALDDPAIRVRILVLADTALLSQFPAARLLPQELRHRIIGQVLDAVVGGPIANIMTVEEIDNLDALNLTQEESVILEVGAPGNSVQGFLVDGETNDQAAMSAAVIEVLGEGWIATPTEVDSDSFRITSQSAILSVPEAWELAHALENHHAVSLAEPMIEWVPAPVEVGGESPDLSSIAGIGSDEGKSCADSAYWSGEKISVQDGWNAAPPGQAKGTGVKVAHLDTGIRHHDFLPIAGNPNVDYSGGLNLFDPITNPQGLRPHDPLTGGFMNQPGHGTQTLSVLLCKTGTFKAKDGVNYTPAIRGVAPEAVAIPFRISPTVVNFNTDRIAKGIRAALDADCDVITMSMGGPEPRTKDLLRVIRRAVESGVIVCTAAGNQIGSNDITPIVVWPAAFDEVIAVAGSNCEDKKWKGSSRGPEVNITAPAESVWRLEGTSPTGVAQGAGTSYATPAVAGIAACWLAKHGGRKALASHYGQARYVPLAFARLLKTVGYRRPAGWDTRLMGPGIIDAGALLRANLPAKAELTTWPVKTHTLSSEVIAAIFKALGWAGFGAAPASATPAPESLAVRYGSELQQILIDRPQLLRQLVDSGLLKADIKDDSTAISAAAAADATIDLSSAEQAISALRAIASPSLAAVLPQ
ncbi:MAG: S8 family peptidase [Luteolibacter sp.]